MNLSASEVLVNPQAGISHPTPVGACAILMLATKTYQISDAE
ncbi:MAG: hypothetical protein V2A54_03230 [Bacteroidota bacterium]